MNKGLQVIAWVGIASSFGGFSSLLAGWLLARSADGQGETAAGFLGMAAMAVGITLVGLAGLMWVPFYFAKD